MARLSDLPAELLLMIIRSLGPAFFRSDIRHLTLFKGWYPHALRELLESIEISTEKLYKLLLSTEAKEQSLKLLQQHAKYLRFQFHGVYQMYHDFQCGVDHRKALIPLEQWARYLRDRHRDVPAVLDGCHCLQSLSFTVHPDTYQQQDPDDDPERYRITITAAEDYIFSSTVRDILSIAYTHKLTALELDLHGSACIIPPNPTSPPAPPETFLHICPGISRLLLSPYLRRLALCINPICPVALYLGPEISQISLEEFVLCITPSAGVHSNVCYGDRQSTSAARFEAQAKHILACMARPKVVKVISHNGPESEYIDMAYYLRVFDVITDEWNNVECSTEYNDSTLDGYLHAGPFGEHLLGGRRRTSFITAASSWFTAGRL
jgi:hypothetical protein